MSAVVEAPAAPSVAPSIEWNEQPQRRHSVPAIDQADARLADAKATLARATAAQGEKASALNAARTKLGNVLNTRTMETAALAQAQSELVPAVLSGADHDEVRQRAQDAQTKIDALSNTAAILTAEMARLQVEHDRHYGPVMSAGKALEEAELHALLAQYAQLIAPAIPLALEIRQRINQWRDDSTCLLNPSDRRIGRNFNVADDGSVYFQLR